MLEELAMDAAAGRSCSFDLVLIDADKEGMHGYFDLLMGSPGLLTDGALVCVDLTPFKGQPPLRYVKYGFPHRWEVNSGQDQIDALRKVVSQSTEFDSHEFGGLLVVQRRTARSHCTVD